MYSKKFYDILSLVFIISIFASSSIVFLFVDSPSAETLTNNGAEIKEIMNASLNSFLYTQIIFMILIIIYAIFIITLAIQMHSKELVSIWDTIFIVLFFPLDFIFYFVTLRKHFKEIDALPSSNIVASPIQASTETSVPQQTI